MPSPFPGMDPYIEGAVGWGDFHSRFLTHAADQLGQQLLPGYVVRLEEHIYVREQEETRRLVGRADLGVADISPTLYPGPGGTHGVALAPAEVGLLDVEFERINHIAIRDRRGHRLVALIELLSPSNKYAGEDRGGYLAKRSTVLSSSAHFVEIDLLRGGPPMPFEDRPDCDYSVLVSRADLRPRAEFWPIGVRDPLPVVRVPIRDLSVSLILPTILAKIYDASGYGQEIYHYKPTPALSAADAAWAEAILAGR